jgi:hypothetical protein
MGRRSAFPGVEEPFLTPARYGAHARMLAASRRSLGGGAPKFLITSSTPDRPGILCDLLDSLIKPLELKGLPRIHSFSVESSMTASLARIGAVAVVVEPVISPDEDASLLTHAADDIIVHLRQQLDAALGPDAAQLHTQRAGFPPVKRLSPGDEFSLYGGRVYREVRFGLRSGGVYRSDISRDAAEKCARILQRFTKALKEYDTPIAFVHFPHGWNSHAPDLSWLRVAYAIDHAVGLDTATEIAAWNIACEEHVALSVYEPSHRGLPYPQRYEHILPPSIARQPSKTSRIGSRVSVCIDGIARTGLLADTLTGLDGLAASPEHPLALFGCTAGVLYGHTVTSLVIDSDFSSELGSNPGALRLAAGLGEKNAVSVQLPDDDAPVMKNKPEATFWVAWCCGEQSGVIRTLMNAVMDSFAEAGAEPPNVEYAISRVLADGFTCAGKMKFSGDPRVIRQLGIQNALYEQGDSRLQEVLVHAIGDALEGWEPPDPAWSERPIWLTASEPREEPWATLVVPEGATEGWR